MLATYNRVAVRPEAIEPFGELTLVWPANARPPSMWCDEFVRQTLHRLDQADYDPRRDYFVIAGNMVSMVRVVGALCAAWDVPIKALFYDAVRGEYVAGAAGLGSAATSSLLETER